MEIVCRICRDTRNKNIIPLLKVVLNSNELEIEGEKFEYCLGLKVLEIPNHPGICTICEQKLNYLYTFKQKAVNSHYELLGFTSKKNDETKRISESFSDFDDLENIEDDNDTLILETMSEVISITESDDEVVHNSLTKEKEKKDETNHFPLEMSVDNNRSSPIENCSNVNQNAEEALSSTMFNDNFDVDTDCDNNGDDSNSRVLNQLSENEECETSNELEFNEKTLKSSKDIQTNESILRRLLKQEKTLSKNTLKSNDDISQIHENLPRKMRRGRKSKNFKKSQMNNLPENIIFQENSRIETYNCDICVQKFYSKQKFEGHMKDHEGLPAFQCNICGKTYKYQCKKYYDNHMKDHQGIPRPYLCELCPNSYHSKRDLKLHLGYHANEKPFVCEICGKRYRSKKNLKLHLCTHSNHNYRCDICNKDFRTKETMRTHRKEMHLPKPFSCKICNKEFGRKCYYEAHIIRHRRLEEKESEKNEGPFVCIACGKEFNDNDALKVHESKTHLPSNICFSCKGCGKMFTKIRCYQNHTTHCEIDKEKTDYLYECKICEKLFNDYDALKAHESKPHPSKKTRWFCKHCGKSLIDNLSYKNHSTNCKIVKEKTNAKEKTIFKKKTIVKEKTEYLSENQYECKTCGEKFTKITHYLNHIEKIHNLECDICHNTYSANHTLYIHFREIHQPKRFSCDKCNKKFGRKFYYEVHMKKNHTHEELETSDNVEKIQKALT